jgi:hypothetical protein
MASSPRTRRGDDMQAQNGSASSRTGGEQNSSNMVNFVPDRLSGSDWLAETLEPCHGLGHGRDYHTSIGSTRFTLAGNTLPNFRSHTGAMATRLCAGRSWCQPIEQTLNVLLPFCYPIWWQPTIQADTRRTTSSKYQEKTRSCRTRHYRAKWAQPHFECGAFDHSLWQS